jgi:opacity protein-like surface antigen
MSRTTGSLLVAAGVLALAPGSVLHGQDGFLFSAPAAQVTLRAGPALPSANSDLFDFLTTELTLERSDFRAPALSAELSFLFGRHWDVGASLGVATSTSHSEYEHFIGDDDLPIEQTTKLRMMPLSATARFYPLATGRKVGTLAWIPTRTTPYVGAGAGVTWYRLNQEGEFIEHGSGIIFRNSYTTGSNNLTLHALAGVTHWFTPHLGLNAEARYTRGSAGTTGSFTQYDRFDLGGTQASLGLSLRW